VPARRCSTACTKPGGAASASMTGSSTSIERGG
jgi:hypothetical protein